MGKLLQIDTGNRPMILALLLQAGCTGVFVAMLELSANVLFMESSGPSRIPLAFMVSGASGILIASIYSYFSKQLNIRAFGILNLVAVILFSMALFAAYRMLEKEQFDFVLFVMAGPLSLITLLGFWITVRGFLSPSKSRQLSGLVEAALIGGMVMAFLGTSMLVRKGVSLELVLFSGLLSLIVAGIAQFYVLNRMERELIYSSRRVSSTGPIRLFSHRYTGLISGFAVLGVAVATIVHYTFLWSSSAQFVESVNLLGFFSIVFSGGVFLAWLTKRFLFPHLKRKFGVGFNLLAGPVILLILSMAGVIAGDLFGMGSGSGVIPLTFMLITLAKFTYIALHGSLEESSMLLFYQSLDPREKSNVKSGIEGVLSQIGVFSVALVLACLISLGSLEIIHVQYFLVVVIMAWFFTGLSLQKAYKKLLRITLGSDRIRDLADYGLQEISTIRLSETAFPIEAIEFNPFFFHYTSREEVMKLLDHPEAGVRMRVWDHLLHTAPGLPQLTLSQLLAREKEPDVKNNIRVMAKRKLRSKLGLQEAFIKERLDRFSENKNDLDPAIGEAFQSGVRNEIFAALYHVATERDSTYLPEVFQLLKEQDLDLRSVAIATAGKIDSRRLSTRLIESLEHPRLYPAAWSALVHQGEGILEELEAAFHKPGASIRLQQRIVSVLTATGSVRALQLMLDKLDYHQREVFTAVVQGLYENHFQANEMQIAAVQNAIMKLVKTGAWNLASKVSIRVAQPGGSLEKGIDQEIWDVNDNILMLLSFIRDRRSVRRIRLNMLDRQSEDRGMAIEMLELLLDEPLKTVLVAYFTDVVIREKLDKLHALFRTELIPVDRLLFKILNRDGMQMGDFMRICVMERMGSNPDYFDEQQIIAQGFHPNPKIRETAAQLLRKNDPGQFDLVTERLDFPVNSFAEHEDLAGWYVNTTINLAAWKLFKNVGINSLFRLVSVLRPFSEEVLAEGDMVVVARSGSADESSSLSKGIAVIAQHQPEILEQIRYLGTQGMQEAYLVRREEFIELLFDDRSLLHVFCAFLSLAGRRQA